MSQRQVLQGKLIVYICIFILILCHILNIREFKIEKILYRNFLKMIYFVISLTNKTLPVNSFCFVSYKPF